nr:hypothetical protein [Tanacetum cinerariifolium]
MYRIDNRSTQTRAPQLPQTVRNTNPRASTSTGVNHNTNVSRPQHRSNQLKDKVLPNNRQVKPKMTQVEIHPRIPSISNKIKSVTACNDSFNSRTLNANAVCATCNKCLVDSNHFACVTKMLNGVNARTKKPNVVPISTRKPKGQANKLVATPHKKKVASKSNNQKPQSYFRMLYEKTSKTWKWWIAQQSPSEYKWVPKTNMQRVPKAKNDKIVQLILFIVDSGCTKHMTGNLKLLCNFVEKFLGTVRFGNDQFAPILGYGDLVQGNVTINKGNDLLIGNCGSDLYTISLQESTSSTPLCLMTKASPTQAWLWHRRLSHLNFDYSNLLSKKDIVIGLPKLKYVKDQLCSSCELSKAKRSLFQSKAVISLKGRLNLLHMDLCGPMRVASINRKKYILVIVDDYSRYTWTLFLRSKDKTPEVLKEFLTMIQRNLQASVITSKGYHVYNKRTRLIAESIYIRFDEIKEVSETSVANDTSGLMYMFHHNKSWIFYLVLCTMNFSMQKKNTYQMMNLTILSVHWHKKLLSLPHTTLDKYTLEILHKHGIDKRQSIGTPMATKPKLDADLSGNPVDQIDYRSKIRSLMYLTSSRPNIVKAYPKGFSFDLTAFSDADHTGCINSRKSTSGGIQFLGDKLVSWILKKQNCTAMSSAEIEYVALSARFLRYDGDECDKGRMPTKIELMLEQSQQGVSNDVLVSIEGVEELKRNVWIKGENKAALPTLKAETGSIHMLSVFTKVNSGIEDKTSWTQ